MSRLRSIHHFSALLTGLALAVFTGEARATTVAFGDTANFWPGFSNGSSDDSVDTIGTPNLLGGRAIFDGSGLLTRVEIDSAGPFSPVASGAAHVIPGDLFIDANADGTWDYVLKLVTGPNTGSAVGPILNVTGVTPAYLLSGTDNTGYWSGYLIRDNHPYAWDAGGTAIDTGSIDPFDELTASPVQILGFNLGSGLAVGSQMIIGFSPNCANDVIYEQVINPVPEPGTAVILGAGLVALTRLSRRARAA